jgi:hypothetical protein
VLTSNSAITEQMEGDPIRLCLSDDGGANRIMRKNGLPDARSGPGISPDHPCQQPRFRRFRRMGAL